MTIIYKNCQLPIEYFGNPHLSTALPQADPCGGGMSQDMSTNWFLGISLKPKTGTESRNILLELKTMLPPMRQQQN